MPLCETPSAAAVLAALPEEKKKGSRNDRLP
jgi:hypothetical protein